MCYFFCLNSIKFYSIQAWSYYVTNNIMGTSSFNWSTKSRNTALHILKHKCVTHSVEKQIHFLSKLFLIKWN